MCHIIIIIITNEKIKMMLSRKRCRGTLQDYNKGEISKCQSYVFVNCWIQWCMSVSGFSMSLFDPIAFSISAFFSYPSVDTDEQVTGSCRIFTKHSKCFDKFFVLAMSVRFDFATL